MSTPYRIFEHLTARSAKRCPSYSAPMLPIPKNSRWNGIVYLHGVLPEPHEDDALHRLILTSGDFGLAYLNERWASRFVSELFRNYIVCFVGYSIADPVMRYMMDALAADRMLGEATLPAYAFGECAPGQEKEQTDEWKAKGVTPVLYTVENYDHSRLHLSLQAWADTYRDGTMGRERLITQHALARPSASTQQDDFVGRTVWALVHESGLPAKHFADLNPTPSLDWLEAFTNERFQHQDLGRFSVPGTIGVDDTLRFSLARRPAPYGLAPRMVLVGNEPQRCDLDETMRQLARWLTRHLNDRKLLVWAVRQGGVLHPHWSWQIERQLQHLAKLHAAGDTLELARMRKHAPNSVPAPAMRSLWRLLLSGRVKTPHQRSDLLDWVSRFKREGLSTTLRLELRELLSPRVRLDEQTFGPDLPSVVGDDVRINQLVHWEVTPTVDGARHWLEDMKSSDWTQVLPRLLPDAQLLLLDALELMQELSEKNGLEKSIWDLPSITPHWQNRHFHEWVVLIELTRDAWLATLAANPELARRTATDWSDMPHAVFQRLALFAAAQDGAVEPATWVDWLLKNDASNLWEGVTMREALRLLVTQGRRLQNAERQRLESAILQGPDPKLFRADQEPDRWNSFVKRAAWLRLRKLEEGELVLGAAAAQRLAKVAAEFPGWELSEHQREEFPRWTSGTGDPDFVSAREVDVAPDKLPALQAWLREEPKERSPFYEDTWRQLCESRFRLAYRALEQLAREDCWPAHRWNMALQTWREAPLSALSARRGMSLVLRMSQQCKLECIQALSSWIEAVAEVELPAGSADFLALVRGVLELPLEAQSGIRNGEGEALNEPVMEAINHPVGHVTTALLAHWLDKKPLDGQGLPAEHRSLMTLLCDRQEARFSHGRVILASRAIALYRVDAAWTSEFLLPLFRWGPDPICAKGAWEGFLWSPRLYLPLLTAFKDDFLETARHYQALGEHQQQFATFLTYVALADFQDFPVAELREAVAGLPAEGLVEVAGALKQAMQGAKAKQDEYFDNRARPFWESVWPQDIARASTPIASKLAHFCIAAGSRFATAVDLVIDWLRPLNHPSYLVSELAESAQCKAAPLQALSLLDHVLVDQMFLGTELQSCLDQVKSADPGLVQDPRFTRLQQLADRRI